MKLVWIVGILYDLRKTDASSHCGDFHRYYKKTLYKSDNYKFCLERVDRSFVLAWPLLPNPYKQKKEEVKR